MAFDRIKNGGKSIKSSGPMSQFFDQTLAMVEDYAYDKPPILRPSGFPICPIRTMIRIEQYKKYGHIPDKMTVLADYFTSVGTTTHEVVQNWMAKTNKMLADWQCVNPDCKRSKCTEGCKSCTNHEHVDKTRQVGNICKLCNHPMVYHEIEVEYDIITGHVDAILKVGKGSFWAGDYKTSSVKKLEKLTAPSLNYLYQISTYSYILKHEYGVPIDGYSIFYIARDNPATYKEFSYEFDAKREREVKKIIDGEIEKYNSALTSIKKKNVDYVIETKPCNNKETYERLMGPYCNCEFVDVCFTKKLKKSVEKAWQEI